MVPELLPILLVHPSSILRLAFAGFLPGQSEPLEK